MSNYEELKAEYIKKLDARIEVFRKEIEHANQGIEFLTNMKNDPKELDSFLLGILKKEIMK